jgi:CPA1 family monovalent cation:H+ antiporter
MVSLGIAVILFEGVLTLDLREIHGGHGRVVRNLVTVGVLVNWLIVSVAAWWLIDFRLGLAFLFGALVSFTGPTVVIPLLRTVKPVATVANILRWEGILIDPIGALLAVLVYGMLVSGQSDHALAIFAGTIAVGVTFGAIGGYGLAVVLSRRWVPDYLRNVVVLAAVVAVFTLSDQIMHEAGLLAVTAMGMLLANYRAASIEDVLDFKESLTLVFVSFLFIVLAARVDLNQLAALDRGAAGVILIILLAARPSAVMLSTIGASLSFREKLLLAWIAPRGIVAAAVSALFSLELAEHGYDKAPLLVTLTFLTITTTVVLHSLTAKPLAAKLGLSEPESQDVLIVGGNRVALVIGKASAERGFRVVVADDSWESVREARMQGLETYYGHPVSEHADRHIDLLGIGHLLAVAQRPELNALACLRYRGEFGSDRVFRCGRPKKTTNRKSVFWHAPWPTITCSEKMSPSQNSPVCWVRGMPSAARA